MLTSLQIAHLITLLNAKHNLKDLWHQCLPHILKGSLDGDRVCGTMAWRRILEAISCS